MCLAPSRAPVSKNAENAAISVSGLNATTSRSATVMPVPSARPARTTASCYTRDAGIEREHALINLRLADAAKQAWRHFSRLTQRAAQRHLVKRLDDQEAGK